MTASFYWYDLETSGTDPRWDRIVQFGGLRTDSALASVGDECVTYVRLPDDVIPLPKAALVTGISPQIGQREGVSEWAALNRINQLFSVPETCVAGFGNLRFDDEFIRYGLFRHLMDPFAREWQNGNSRWDILDLARAAGALRPEGIEWPHDEEGLPVYRLEALAAANGLSHGQPHDALSDVRATLALARLLRTRQRRLFDYYFTGRFKRQPRHLLEPFGAKVRLHISGMYPRRRYGFAPVASICGHPTNANSIIVADVGEDVECLVAWPEDRLREALFGADVEVRPPLKEVRVNKSPFLAPLSVVRPADAERLGFDAGLAEARRRLLRQPEVAAKVRRVYASKAQDGSPAASALDVEVALYDGFVGDDDRARCQSFNRGLAQGEWLDLDYRDRRLAPLAARVKARSFPERQGDGERTDWRAWVRAKINAPEAPWATLASAQKELDALRASGAASQELLDALGAHLGRLRVEYGG